MTAKLEATRQAFRALHREGCFALPNVWDLGGLRRIERLGFTAVASTSAGLAWSLGCEDYELELADVIAHLRTLSDASDLPVNADFENGFADAPDDVARNVVLAADAGVSGLSIEDRGKAGLYDIDLGAARIKAARAALDRTAPSVILVGRSEGFLVGDKDIDRTITRLVAYAAAGADSLYAPGVTDPDQIRQIVAAVAPKPVNVLLMSPAMGMADMADLGVRRVSIGGALARRAWTAFDDAARYFRDEGRLP
jgi:2-methylisocitrate lyase-like PEP mutase family enzyme